MKSHYYNLSVLGIISCCSLLVAGFNAAIDPFAVMNTPTFRGINRSKPETVDHSRLYKAVDVTRQKAQIILVGSSRVETGIDPDFLSQQTARTVYNIALPSAKLYEQFRYLEHALTIQKDVKLVILGIDNWLLYNPYKNTGDFDEERLGTNGLRLLEALQINFSLDTISKSLQTIETNQKKPDYTYYYLNGRRDTAYLGYDFDQWIKGWGRNKDESTLSPVAINSLKKIRDLCKEKRIELIAFITPEHALQLETAYLQGRGKIIEQGKRELVKMMPVWDFSGYNSITTEPVSDRMENYTDTSHFTLKVGNLILARILQKQEDKVPKDFGILLTPNNVELHLAKIQADRQLWLKNNHKVISFLEKIKF